MSLPQLSLSTQTPPAAAQSAAPRSETDAASSSRLRAGHVLLLLAILIFAAAVRFHRIGATGMWYDEFGTVEDSTGKGGSTHSLIPVDEILNPPPDLTSLQNALPWHAIWNAMDLNTAPPLYYMLVRFWREGFGSSDAAIRSLSAGMGIVAIVLLFDAGRLLHGTRVALWAAAIMAAAAPQITYSQEARNYMTLIAIGLAAVCVMIRIEQRGASVPRLILLFITVFALPLTHYFSAGACAGLAAYAAVRLRGRDRVRTLACLVAVIVVYTATWGPHMIPQLRWRGTQDWVIDRRPDHATSTILRLLSLPCQYLTAVRDEGVGIGIAAAVLFVLPLLLLRKRPSLLIWIFWAVGTIGLIFAIDMGRHSYHLYFTRYTLLAAPAFYVLIPAIAPANRFLRHALPAVAVLGGLTALPYLYQPKSSWHELAEVVRASVQPGDVLLFCDVQAPFGPLGQGYTYLATTRYAGLPPCPTAQLSGTQLSDSISRKIEATNRVWLLIPVQATKMPDLPQFRTVHLWAYPDIAKLAQLDRIQHAEPATAP